MAMTWDTQTLINWVAAALAFALVLSVWLAVVLAWASRRLREDRVRQRLGSVSTQAPPSETGRMLRLWREGREVAMIRLLRCESHSRALIAACFLGVAAMALATAGCSGLGQKGQPSNPAARNLSAEEPRVGDDRPPTIRTRYAMARLMAAQGRDDESEAVFKQILAESPSFMPAYCDLAELQMRQQRLDDATRTLRAGLTIEPRNPVLYNNLGLCCMLRGDYQGALEMLTEAAANMPQNTRYRANLALALGMMGRYEEAFALEQQVLPLAAAHQNMAIIHAARGDRARAAEEQATAENLAAHAAKP